MALNKDEQKQFDYLNKKSKDDDVFEHMDQWGQPTLNAVLGTAKYITGYKYWSGK